MSVDVVVVFNVNVNVIVIAVVLFVSSPITIKNPFWVIY